MMARQMAKGPAVGQRVSPGEGGLQQVQPLEEEPQARLQPQWQQEAIPVHLLPLGWPAVTVGPRPLSLPPPRWGRALTGGWTKGARVSLPSSSPPPLAGSMAFRPLPAEALFLSSTSVQSLFGSWWKGRSSLETPVFLPKLLFWWMTSYKFSCGGEPGEVEAGLASIP